MKMRSGQVASLRQDTHYTGVRVGRSSRGRSSSRGPAVLTQVCVQADLSRYPLGWISRGGSKGAVASSRSYSPGVELPPRVVQKHYNERNEDNSQEQVIHRSVLKGPMHLTLGKVNSPNSGLRSSTKSGCTIVHRFGSTCATTHLCLAPSGPMRLLIHVPG